MDNANLVATNLLGMLEGESQNTLASLPGNKLNALNDTVNNDMLDTRVFTLRVLSDQDGVNIVICRLVTSDRSAWP